jgi:uncharacterized RDD family membrane protein YckC
MARTGATYADAFRRFGAACLDWAIAFWLPLYAAAAVSGPADPGSAAASGSLLPALVVALCVVAYFGVSCRLGQSAGMALFGISTRDAVGGGPAAWPRALLRGILALILAASTLLLAMVSFGDPPEHGYSAPEIAVIVVAAALFMGSIMGHLWMLWDPRRQTLQDKACRVVVVRTGS